MSIRASLQKFMLTEELIIYTCTFAIIVRLVTLKDNEGLMAENLEKIATD